MARAKTLGREKASIRVLFPREDYEALQKIAKLERTDISTLIRRAVARYFFMTNDGNAVKQ